MDSSGQSDVSLSMNPEEVIPPKYTSSQIYETDSSVVADEGYLDLQNVKDLIIGNSRLENREVQELTSAAKKHGLEDVNVIGLLYGNNLNDNRTVYLVMPLQSFR